MKKFYSFALILLSLFSCVVFSACGNKYKDLKISVFSSEGEQISVAEFVIDSSKDATKTVGFEFSGIDRDDIGQIVVYSIPQELVTVSNYSYTGNRCYVDITPNMSSGENAKLVVSHLNSGKKKTIDLKIDQKATSINVFATSYVISIPQTEAVSHYVDFSKLINLLPSGSTDKIYFKVAEGTTLKNNIMPINLVDVEGYEDVLTGFEVSAGDESQIEIYPITYMKGYSRGETDPYKNQKIIIYFKNALTDENVKIKDEIEQLDLIANDDNLNLFKISLINQNDALLTETDCFEFYNLNVEASEQLKISTIVDSNNDIIIKANTYTDDYVDVVISLSPKMAGNLETIEKIVKVKGNAKADTIYVEKSQEQVEDLDSINIFDYYDDGGNSLGALFTFKPITNNGSPVHDDLKTMQIIVDPKILSKDNLSKDSDTPENIDSTLYSLVLHHVSLITNDPFKEADLLMFTYENGKMVSEPISATSKIYIKYIKHASEEGRYEPTNFGLEVKTLNKSENEFWQGMEQKSISLNFNRLEGVATASLQAGEYYYDENGFLDTIPGSVENPECIYVDRLKGLNNLNDEVKRLFVGVIDDSVKNVDGDKISSVDFIVTVEPLQEVENPLKLALGTVVKDEAVAVPTVSGSSRIIYNYNSSSDIDIVSLVFRSTTSLGDYKITFYQESIEKASLICRVYQSLDGLDKSYVDLETNSKAFENLKYTDSYESQYIVASGQNLNLSINLPESVLNSDIVVGYALSNFSIVDSLSAVADEEPEDPEPDEPINPYDYFNVQQDHETLNFAILQFKKGTYIKGEPQYVVLNLVVKTKIYEDITKESTEVDDTTNKIQLTFFIYEEIKSTDASINNTSMTRYVSEYLGKYYEDLSKATLTINMSEELWKYVTPFIVEDGGTKTFKEIDWKINDSSAVTMGTSDYSCNLTFGELSGYPTYERTVSAYIQQFDKLFEYKCVFFVEKPILTEKLVIGSEVYDDNGQFYINLKKGETYTVEASNYSSKGEVTHKDIIIQVTDSFGNAITSYDYFKIDQDNGTIEVTEVDNLHSFTLVVFAKDVLNQIVNSVMSGYNNPSSFIKKDFDGKIINDYLNAFVEIEIHLSDGTIDNPYEIHSAEDFWEIDDSDELKKAHYKLMNSINLDGSSYLGSKIEDFTGSIVTNNNETFTIDGITLDASNPNLFQGFKIDDDDTEGITGKISNVRFVVKYAYVIDNSKNDDIYLGLFDKNEGTLENVKVQVSGSAQLTGTATYYFGALAGENSNKIVYSSGYGVTGTINVTGAKVHFGGLVGKNTASIVGYETSNNQGGENEIILNSGSASSNAISMINVEKTEITTGSIGGVVGLNAGTIKNMFVQANIVANASNVGGVIGKNEQSTSAVNVTMTGSYVSVDVTSEDNKEVLSNSNTQAIYNVKSASTISANDYVGGIVGHDTNGVYIECDYQIGNATNKSIALSGVNNVGGIAGYSDCGKFAYCSVMSYNWNYSALKTDASKVITDVADISGTDYVGGIVGQANSSNSLLNGGSQSLSDRTMVAYSSVNAYLQATSTNTTIGGILTVSDSKISILYNVYFIGKLDGNVSYFESGTGSFALDNTRTSLFDSAYSINIEEAGAKTGSSYNGNAMTYWYGEENYSSLADFWGWLKDVNGDYIFITMDKDATDSSLPIYDLAPETIEVTVKEDKRAEESLDRILKLDYYDFSLNKNISDETLEDLNKKYNQNQQILNLLDIHAKPSGLGTVVVNVKSTNTTVVDVQFDGTLIINGVGECDLIFSSILNSNAGIEANRTIHVIVDNPIGDSFSITKYLNDEGNILNDSSTEKIAQNTTKQFYVFTKGSKTEDENTINEKTYSYTTKTNVYLSVQVSYDGELTIENYIQISGITNATSTYDRSSNKSTLNVKLDDKTPFTISVLKMLKDSTFTVSIKPYVMVDGKEVYLKDVQGNDATSFNLSTLKGVTGVSFSYDDAIVYPNDTVYLTIQLQTDDPIKYDDSTQKVNITDLQEVIEKLLEKDTDIRNEYNLWFDAENDSKVKYNIYVDRSSYNLNTQIQTITLRIEFEEMELDEPENMKLILTTSKAEAEVKFRIIPQRIDKIEIKNYFYKNQDANTKVLEQMDILKPNDFGLIIIDLVPNNAYYDYLEISDITGNEEIVFIQIESENGKAYALQDKSSDGKGIKLYNYNNASRLYVRTQISNTYSSKIHTIEIRAYDSDETQLGSSFKKQIDVKMLPEIVADYILPNGSVGLSINSTEEAEKTGAYLATGVDAIFTISIKNADKLEVNKSGTESDNYELVKVTETQYKLKATSKAIVGKTISLNMTAYAYMDNGDYDITSSSITFTIVDFVIHGVSVNSSINNLTTQEIYGYYERTVNLKFYFAETDISYYDESSTGEKFWDTTYEYYLGAENDETLTDTEKQIYSILKVLNGYDSPNNLKETNDYLILNTNKKDNNKYTETFPQGNVLNEPTNTQKVQLYQNQLTVQEGYDKDIVDKKEVDSPKYLAVAFRLYYDSGWKIEKYDSTELRDSYKYIVNKNYKLNFMAVTQWDEPDVVNNEEDFYNMSSGKQYILNADLTFEDYTPIDADLIYFDGNGHTITIHSFATQTGTAMNLGLFAKIYPDMLVKNVHVEYVSLKVNGNYTLGHVEKSGSTYKVEYADLALGAPALSEAKFGGITAENTGIITNCMVSGLIAVNASTLESAGNYQIAFNLGGLVAENASTGYITNSQSELNMFALANIGGFVYSNAGKIVSCGVEEKTTIYGYNTNLSNTIVSEIAGFVVRNTGEISMCYVNMNAQEYAIKYAEKKNSINSIETSSSVKINGGLMSAKDISAGFVYSNSGKISDAYVQMTKTGVNNNSFAGFVYSNSGSISKAYTYLNAGSRVDSNSTMFAPANISGIENCVEFVSSTSGYSSGVAGLDTQLVSNRYSKSVYQSLGFAIGDNESAVWFMKSGNLPRLVSTQELKFEAFAPVSIKYIEDTDISDGVDNSHWKAYYDTYGTKENPYIIYDLTTWNDYFNYDLNNGIMTGYYRIVKDIDFSSLGKNPSTSELVFKGNIQGNNMKITGIMLYSNEGLDALGLFKQLQGTSDSTIKNAVRNLKISATSVWASSTNAVGILAGIIENFNIYNITIDSEGVIIVGKNAVGGLAGVVRGDFDLDQISSNIGANSTRASTLNSYSIYMSKNNNKSVSSNLSSVYYAGSVVGILDGYSSTGFDISVTTRSLTSKYFKVHNIAVSGDVTVAGDIVGGAFGFVGECVYVDDVNVDITGSLFGSQHSAGVVGENRGVVRDVNVNLASGMFDNAKYVMAGAVGLNIGGLVDDIDVKANISKTEHGYVVAGVVGRNVHGTVSNVHFDGELYAYITGGIIGTDYDYEIFISKTSGGNSINVECDKIVPESEVKYSSETGFTHLSNVSLGGTAFRYMIENSSRFYSYQKTTAETPTLADLTVKSKVLGLVVGLSFDDSIVTRDSDKLMINIETSEGEVSCVTFNASNSNVAHKTESETILLKKGLTTDEDVSCDFIGFDYVDLLNDDISYVMYLKGSKVTAFDSWSGYSDEYLIIK